MDHSIKTIKKTIKSHHLEIEIPFDGFEKNNVITGPIDLLRDEDLVNLNKILRWNCFTIDSKGRKFGNAAWKGKRDKPQAVPDKRILEMNRAFDLAKKSVLEVGCFEGIHTAALASLAHKTYAIDSRIDNVVKTIVRTHLFGFSPQVSVCNLELDEDVARLPIVDFVHHVGVLYHLTDPVANLIKLDDIARSGLLLDTHYASSDMTNASYTSSGRDYRYYHYREHGIDEEFSGMGDHSKWLLFDDIKAILTQVGFSDIRVLKDNKLGRNGPRVTILAARPGIIIE